MVHSGLVASRPPGLHIGAAPAPLSGSAQLTRRRFDADSVFRPTLLLTAVRMTVLAALATLALVTLVPRAFGWQPTIVISGSMSPAINTGDVIVTAPVGRSLVPVGSVILGRDPSRAHDLLLHRVVGRNADGSLTTKGDANVSTDSAAMPLANLRGIGRLRIPMIGIPLLRARQGDWVPAGALVLVVVMLSAPSLMIRPRRGELAAE
jgi:signal peptidase